MSVKHDRIQVYPSPQALGYLGADVDGEIAPTLNTAIEMFADHIARATRDNEKLLTRAEWNFLADTCNGLAITPGLDAHSHLIAQAEDAQSLDATGDKWFGEGEGNSKVAQLVTKIKSLDSVHAWAILWGTLYFWSHHDAIKMARDEWWTLKFRTH